MGKDYVMEGWWGTGPPMATQKSPGRFGRPFQDGGGLCCPGRWTPGSRVLPPKARKLTDSLDAWLFKFAGKVGEAALEKLVYCLVAGRFSLTPL